MSCRQGSSGASDRCTTTFKNAHETVFRELHYRWHPWFGLQVAIHEAVDKADGVVFRCALNGSAADRWLEVPAWMFDRTPCSYLLQLTASPFVGMNALLALSELLRQAIQHAAAIGRVIELRRQGLSTYEISRRLTAEDTPLNRTPSLRSSPRRGSAGRCGAPNPRSISPATSGRDALAGAAVIDFRTWPERLDTTRAGLLLVVPDLAALDLAGLAARPATPAPGSSPPLLAAVPAGAQAHPNPAGLPRR